MSLVYADPAQLRAIADRIGRQAAATQASADALVNAVGAVRWTGLAADAFHGQANLAMNRLRTAAGSLDRAAALLRRHADSVEQLLTQLAGLVADAADLGSDVLHAARDSVADPGAVLQDGVRLIGDGGELVAHGAAAVWDFLT